MEDRLVGLNFNGFVPRATEFPFRDPMDVYLEFFGGRDPIGHTSQGQPLFTMHALTVAEIQG